eukprot:1209906-Pleurochrysis_carterae.AAC.2
MNDVSTVIPPSQYLELHDNRNRKTFTVLHYRTSCADMKALRRHKGSRRYRHKLYCPMRCGRLGTPANSNARHALLGVHDLIS